MHINVRDILVEGVGYSQAYKISGERPELEGLDLTKDIEGDVTIARLDTGLLVQGHLASALNLECHRCLRTFERPVRVKFKQLYSEHPEDDDLPIEDETIDLAPLARQEFLLSLPIKILCRPDCTGVAEAEAYAPAATDTSLKAQARITERKTPRGRSEETNNQ
jgi:uncharacterized protein